MTLIVVVELIGPIQ